MKTTLRLTRQRKVILEELEKTRRHPTADELFKVVRRRLPRISLGTVYRNLELMCREGSINKLTMGGGPFRFDADICEHSHVRCAECGRVDDVKIDHAQLRPARLLGYRIQSCHLEFIGVCPDCQKQAKAASG